MADWRMTLSCDGFELMPGAQASAIDTAEDAVGLRFPCDLRLLYLASDGVFDSGGQWWVIWPLATLAQENTLRRRAGVLPAGLIAFGDDGTGDAFCVEPGKQSVSCWHPIGACKQPLAPDLAAFWHGWTGGAIST